MTQHLLAEFSELYRADMKTQELASHFGVGQSTIFRWARKLGLPRRSRYSKAHRKPGNSVGFDDDECSLLPWWVSWEAIQLIRKERKETNI